MSWLTANEVFFMEVVVRDRVDDLRSSIDLTIASVDGAGETSRDVPEADRATPPRSLANRAIDLVVWHLPGFGKPDALRGPGEAITMRPTAVKTGRS